MKQRLTYHLITLLIAFILTGNKVAAQYASNDTLQTYAVVYDGDTIEAKTLITVYIKQKKAGNKPTAGQNGQD